MNTAPTHEDRLAAAICHASILVPFIGISIPIGMLIAERKQTGWLKFHAQQALVVDLVPVIAMFLYYLLMFLTAFIMVGAFLIGMLASNNSPSSSLSPAGGAIVMLGFLIFFGTMMLFNALYMIVVPVVGIVALIAAVLTLKGQNFRYPIMAKIIERRASRAVVAAS